MSKGAGLLSPNCHRRLSPLQQKAVLEDSVLGSSWGSDFSSGHHRIGGRPRRTSTPLEISCKTLQKAFECSRGQGTSLSCCWHTQFLWQQQEVLGGAMLRSSSYSSCSIGPSSLILSTLISSWSARQSSFSVLLSEIL